MSDRKPHVRILLAGAGQEGRSARGTSRCLSRAALAAIVATALALVIAATATASAGRPFLGGFGAISKVASTVPASGPAAGDQNPYGTAVVPRTVGKLVRGDVLVSNFNDATNAQGTGSSVVEVSPRPKFIEQLRDVVHIGRPAIGRRRLATAKATTVHENDLVVIGERTLFGKRFRTPPE